MRLFACVDPSGEGLGRRPIGVDLKGVGGVVEGVGVVWPGAVEDWAGSVDPEGCRRAEGGCCFETSELKEAGKIEVGGESEGAVTFIQVMEVDGGASEAGEGRACHEDLGA